VGTPSDPRSLRSNMLRISLARSVQEFEAQTAGRHDAIRTGLHLDFAFVAAYWLIYATTSALFATRTFSGADWLGAVAGELATIGALSDVSENVNTLRLLERIEGTEGDDEPTSVARTMRRSSLLKWTALFAATGVLSTMFFERGGWNCVLGGLYAGAALLGLVTILADAFRLSIEDRWLGLGLRFAFFLQCIALPAGLAVAASQT
jgi:hypothetical protein